MRTVLVRIRRTFHMDFAGLDDLKDMKVDKIKPQKNFSRVYTVIVVGSVIGFIVVCVRRLGQERVLRFPRIVYIVS